MRATWGGRRVYENGFFASVGGQGATLLWQRHRSVRLEGMRAIAGPPWRQQANVRIRTPKQPLARQVLSALRSFRDIPVFF